MNTKIGLCSISFRGHSPEEIIDEMHSAGLRYIEWGSDVHAPCDDLDRLNKITELQKHKGIKCCSYGTYFRLGRTPLCELDGYIKAAKLLGADVLRVWCGDKSSINYTDEERADLIDVCRFAAKIAEGHGVKLCMECHLNTYTDTKDAAYTLMKKVNSEHFRMYWQPNQHRSLEENKEYARLLSPYTEHLHVFNWNGKEKYPLIASASTWREYLYCFDRSKDRVLLLEFMPDDKISSLKQEAEALRSIAGC